MSLLRLCISFTKDGGFGGWGRGSRVGLDFRDVYWWLRVSEDFRKVIWSGNEVVFGVIEVKFVIWRSFEVIQEMFLV